MGDPSAVMVDADEELTVIQVLGDMDKAGVTVFEDIVDEFLDHAEDEQFLFRSQSVPVIVEPAAGVDGAGAGYFLEEVIYGGFQTKVLQGRRHQAMGDIPDELDGIVNDLLGVIDALQLGIDILVYEVFVEVEAGGGEEGAGVIVEVSGDALAFFFLPADRCVKEDLLLFLLHFLELHLVFDDPALVENDKYDQADSEYQHADRSEEQNVGHSR